MTALPHVSAHPELSFPAFFWCACFFMLGPLLILLNSHVVNNTEYKYPIAFSFVGIGGTAALIHTLVGIGVIQIQKEISFKYWVKRIVPVGIISGATIACGNSVYMYISVSFTQMLKALTPVYILALMVLLKIEIPRKIVVLAVTVITLGTMTASLGELRFSWAGFLLQSLADVFEGSRLVLLQIMMSDDALSPVDSMYYLLPATALAQAVLVCVYEPDAVFSAASWSFIANEWYWFVAELVLGLGINVVGMFVIKHTSGLMMKLLGVLRNNCLVLFSVIFLGEATTWLQMMGYAVSILGFLWYSKLTHGGQSEKTTALPSKIKYSQITTDEEISEF